MKPYSGYTNFRVECLPGIVYDDRTHVRLIT